MATDAEAAQQAIARFLEDSRQPALLEPGEPRFLLNTDNFSFELRNSRLSVHVWDADRALFRKIRKVKTERQGQLELETEHFGNRTGEMTLLDLSRPKSQPRSRRGERLAFRERLRRYITRQFPGWQVSDLSAEPDLEHSLSPAYPRGSARKGSAVWACIGAPPESDPDGVLSFGLIWYEYLRRRETRRTVEGLAVFVPEASERTTALRMLWLPTLELRLFVYSPEDYETRVDLSDCGNLLSGLEPIRLQAPRPNPAPELQPLWNIPGVEAVEARDGSTSLRVRGYEFARVNGAPQEDLEPLARQLSLRRSGDAPDRQSNLYLSHPELWLEGQVRANLRTVEASLLPSPVHSQVPAFAASDRGIIDLLACDCTGRLAVLELKASQDLHLPLQALDYWIRVKRELEQGRLANLFPGTVLRQDPPRLLLVAPALEFHPATPIVLRHFSSEIDVQQIGLGMGWRSEIAVAFRLRGAESRA